VEIASINVVSELFRVHMEFENNNLKEEYLLLGVLVKGFALFLLWLVLLFMVCESITLTLVDVGGSVMLILYKGWDIPEISLSLILFFAYEKNMIFEIK